MSRAIQLSTETLDTIRRHAELDYPVECCGLLVGSVCNDCMIVERVVHAENIAEGDRRQSYQIDWESLFRAVKALRGSSRRIIGFYHSHPDGSHAPSQADLDLSWREHVYLVLPVSGGKAAAPSAWFLHEGDCRFAEIRVSMVG